MSELNPETRRAAFLVAGHAVGAWLEGLKVKRVFFRPEEEEVWLDIVEPILPSAGSLWNHKDRLAGKRIIRALLFGPAAQEMYSFGACAIELDLSSDEISTEPSVWRALDIAGRIPSTLPIVPRLWCEVRLSLNLTGTWAAIRVIAEMLVESRDLTGDEVVDFASHAVRAVRRP